MALRPAQGEIIVAFKDKRRGSSGLLFWALVLERGADTGHRIASGDVVRFDRHAIVDKDGWTARVRAADVVVDNAQYQQQQQQSEQQQQSQQQQQGDLPGRPGTGSGGPWDDDDGGQQQQQQQF